MKKQVLAIIFATLLILSTFAACGKKYLVYTDSDGVTHPVLTDAEGNTMVNEFGQIVVGVTDSRGRLVTEENGEYETRGMEFPSVIASNNVFETPDFKWPVPEGLWTVNQTGFQKKDSEIWVEISGNTQLETLEKQEQQDDKFIQYLQSQNIKIDFQKEHFSLQNSVPVLHYSISLYNDDGSLKEHREVFYFQRNETIYSIAAIEPESEMGTVNYIDLLNMIKFRT